VTAADTEVGGVPEGVLATFEDDDNDDDKGNTEGNSATGVVDTSDD
jgi:hypothetical protein